MTRPELSRPIDRRHLTARPVRIEATAEERAALAKRFGLIAIHRLEADVALTAEGDAVETRGRLRADIVQSCAVTGDDLPVIIDEPLAFRFVPEQAVEEEEVELDESELDEIPYSGDVFDLGEAVAQSLSLAIDPYAVGPDADRARKETGLDGEAASGPFAALAALKRS